jgi:hypothetical protein
MRCRACFAVEAAARARRAGNLDEGKRGDGHGLLPNAFVHTIMHYARMKKHYFRRMMLGNALRCYL